MEKMRFESVDEFSGKYPQACGYFPVMRKRTKKITMGRQSEKSISIRCAFFWESIKRKAKHANFHGSESGKP